MSFLLYILHSPFYSFFTHKYKTIGHHFGFHGLRFLKPSYVSIVALLPRPEGIGDSLYRFISNIKEIGRDSNPRLRLLHLRSVQLSYAISLIIHAVIFANIKREYINFTRRTPIFPSGSWYIFRYSSSFDLASCIAFAIISFPISFQ